MSTTAGTRAVPQPPGGQAQPPAGKDQAGGLNLGAATALVSRLASRLQALKRQRVTACEQ